MPADIIARLQLRGQQFSSENARLFGELEARARDTATRTKNSFERSFADVQRIAQQALSAPRTESGSLDVGAGRYRDAAAAAQNQAQALREVEAAARRAAAATGDTSQETRLYIQAANAAALEAEELARAHTLEANSLDRLQAEMSATATRSAALTTGQRQSADASRNHQFAMRNLGFQLSDVGASFASGASLAMIFGQQIGQVGGALSDMNGRLGVVGRFLTNPWVAALTTGIVVLATMTSKLGDGAAALDNVKFASDGLGDAQSLLGRTMDLTTGKVTAQRNELIALGIAQAKVSQLQAAARAEEMRGTIRDVGGRRLNVSGGMGGGLGVSYQSDPALKAISEGVLSGKIETIDALDRLENMRRIGKLTTEEFSQAAAAVAGLNVELGNIKISEAAERVLRGVGTAQDKALFRKPEKPKDNSRAIAARDEFGRDANDRIASIADRFGDAPSQIQQANKAMRQLDDIMDDLGRRKPPGFEATIRSAQEAKKVVQDSLTRPFEEFVRAQEESLVIGRLLAQGHETEAAALADVFRLQRQMGPLTDAQLAKVRAVADENERIARGIEDQRRLIGIYTSAVGDAQRTFEDFLTTLSRKPGEAFKNLGKDLMANLKSLQVRLISEKLFGGLDREIADLINGKKGPQAAIDVLAKESTRAGVAMGDIADAATDAARRLFNLDTPATLPSGRTPGLLTGTEASDEIVVTAIRKGADAEKRSSDRMVSAVDTIAAINDRFVKRLDVLFGTTLPDVLKQALSGALTGYAVAGPVGGVIGGVGGLLKQTMGDDFAKIFGDKFDKALKGAQTGTMVAGIGKALGLKMSTTGSQIGGAIGSAIPIPGMDIVGSIAGGFIGGAFKKAKYGTAGIVSDGYGGLAGDVLSGRGSANKSAALGAAGSVADGIEAIAKQLGAAISGVPNITIGTYKDNYRVSTTGYQGKLNFKGNTGPGGKGLYDFGDDQQAAVTFAIKEAISRSVITGISEASKRILQSGQDMEKALEKATTIESIPKMLRQRLDPMGYGIDELNKKYADTIKVLKEGGATAQQMAEAQQLYNLELADVKKQAGSAASSLKEMRDSMLMGSSSPLSLRDQESAARTALQPYLDDIAGGKAIDQDAYRQAAETYLDIERQLKGSTADFFTEWDRIMAATEQAIAKIDNAQPIKPTTPDPFAQATATATQATASAAQATNQTLSDILAQLQRMASNGNLPGGFIGAQRYF